MSTFGSHTTGGSEPRNFSPMIEESSGSSHPSFKMCGGAITGSNIELQPVDCCACIKFTQSRPNFARCHQLLNSFQVKPPLDQPRYMTAYVAHSTQCQGLTRGLDLGQSLTQMAVVSQLDSGCISLRWSLPAAPPCHFSPCITSHATRHTSSCCLPSTSQPSKQGGRL
jgi:hypothetical protein